MMRLKEDSGLAQITADMKHLCETIGNRMAGWPGEERAADYMAKRLTELGLTNVAKLPFRCKRWRLEGGNLRLLDGQEQVLPCAPVAHAPSTPAHGVEGELVILEPVDFENGLRPNDLTGKIALFRGSYPESAERFAELHDAPLAALIFIDPRMQTDWPIANGMGEKHMALAKKPMAYVSLMHAWELAKRQVRRVRLTSLGKAEDAKSWNVAADLPGEDPNGRIIVVSGHLDTIALGVGADDNAVGIAATLETARRLKALPRRHTVRFIGFGAEEQLSVGSFRYVKEQADDLDRVAFVCNFDSMAAWFGASESISTGTPELDAFAKAILEERLGWGLVRAGVSPYQDAYPFALAGIPGLWLGRMTHGEARWFHHSIHDDLSACAMEKIAAGAEAACELLGELVNRDDWPFERRLAPEIREAVDRYGRELFE